MGLKRGFFFVFGAAARLYQDDDYGGEPERFFEESNQLEDSALFNYDPTEHEPSELLDAYDGYDGYELINEDDYDELVKLRYATGWTEPLY